MKLDRVKDEELGFGAEVGRVGKTRKFKIAFGAGGDRARVEGVALLRNRVHDIGNQTERRLFRERLHPIARRIGYEQHVGFMD